MKNRILNLVLTFVFAFFAQNIVAQNTNIVTQNIKVSGNCDDCKRRIEKACFRVAGVQKADWNDETGILTITFNNKKATLDKIEQSVARFGYDTEHHKGSDKAYKKLPHCCQYRDGNPHKE
ncbi:MAG: hypothetical protein RL757_270 [Bacteroidota bacterium]|jgi:copper chaperone CopZ